LKNTRPATGKANDGFAGEDGDVARNAQRGWEAGGQKGWEKPEAAGAPQDIDSADLNCSAAAPQRGARVPARLFNVPGHAGGVTAHVAAGDKILIQIRGRGTGAAAAGKRRVQRCTPPPAYTKRAMECPWPVD
jgi:hypothetical protein